MCVAAGLFGLDQGGILAILAEHNMRRDPPWSERDLRYKAEDAVRKASCPPTFLEGADSWVGRRRRLRPGGAVRHFTGQSGGSRGKAVGEPERASVNSQGRQPG